MSTWEWFYKRMNYLRDCLLISSVPQRRCCFSPKERSFDVCNLTFSHTSGCNSLHETSLQPHSPFPHTCAILRLFCQARASVILYCTCVCAGVVKSAIKNRTVVRSAAPRTPLRSGSISVVNPKHPCQTIVIIDSGR